MDDKDENIKNIIENQQDDSEADEAKTIDELIKKKADNEFNVSENTAHTQIYLQNAYYVVLCIYNSGKGVDNEE